MPGAKLPAVRLPSSMTQNDESGNSTPVVVELPSASKFGFAWPTDSVPSVQQALSPERTVPLSSSEGETDHSDTEKTSGLQSNADHSGDEIPPNFNHPSTSEQRTSLEQVKKSPSLPRLSRALSMPLPSRLGHLQNPHRPSGSPSSPTSEVAFEHDQFHELSLELADSVQTIVQTLLQISPSQVLDPAKEQFSACSLSVPTPCMSAVFTSMKNLNYISANMAAFCASPKNNLELISPAPPGVPSAVPDDFDIGELLQNIGDTLSGAAAQAGVDLVLYHGDVGMKHVAVKGDECGISYALSHIIRQVIGTARRGDSIEIGLFIATSPPVLPTDPDTTPNSESPPSLPTPVSESEDPLWCLFDIAHNFAVPDGCPPIETNETQEGSSHPSSPSSRPRPVFNSRILQRLLRQLDASLTPDLQPKAFFGGRACELALSLHRGSPAAVDARTAPPPEDVAYQLLSGIRIADEPTLEELAQFTETLRGKKVTLYASSKSSFAHHLTSYLTAWGLDVSHVSAELGVDGSALPTEGIQGRLPPPAMGPRAISNSPLRSLTYTAGSEAFAQALALPSPLPPVSAGPGQPATNAMSFIFIDDDVSVLRERLRKLRLPQAYPLTLSRKRPSLAPHHRPRSTSHVQRPALVVVIVHFTSLTNYKLVKDVIQSDLTMYPSNFSGIPEVMIIPKPAGPRRFLTALHTAVTKPIVDPFFSPIATSPTTSGQGSFLDFNNPGTPSPKSPTGTSRSSPRTNSDRSTRSPKETPVESTVLPLPSPLSMSDSMEYFSEAAAKLGASPSQGLVIQSPSGQPAGIFFHPKGKGKSSSTVIDRERGQFLVATDRMRGGSASRRSSNGSDIKSPLLPHSSVSFSALHSVTVSPMPTSERENQASTAGTVARGRRPSSPDETSVPTSPRRAPTLTQSNSLTKSTTSVPPTETSIASTPTRRSTRRGTIDSKQSPQAGKGPDASIVVPPISVLIVDDNPINQTILSTFMKKKKIKFDVAKNGEEAVSKWRTGGFHLILATNFDRKHAQMDIQMPIMDGIQATKEIRLMEKLNSSSGFPLSTPRSEAPPRTPPLRTPSEAPSTSTSSPYRSSVIIVALTASSLQSDRVAALAAGCNDFLTKPVSLQWLNNKIIEWGSIKALQMWADLRPEVVKSIATGQTAQARNVARRLHVPEGRITPSAPPSRSPSVTRTANTPQDPAVRMTTRKPSVVKDDLSDSPPSSDSEPHPAVTTDPPTDSALLDQLSTDPPTQDDDSSPSSDQYSTADSSL